MCEPLAHVWPVSVANLLVGVAVEDARGCRFVAVDRRFRVLDDSRFRRLDDACRAAGRVARAIAPVDGEEAWRPSAA